MREIQILIMGETGNGKTTIANKISKILKDAGIKVELIDGDSSGITPEILTKSFDKMVSNNDTHITIRTIQSRKDSIDDIKFMLRDESVKQSYTNAISCNCKEYCNACKGGVRKL